MVGTYINTLDLQEELEEFSEEEKKRLEKIKIDANFQTEADLHGFANALPLTGDNLTQARKIALNWGCWTYRGKTGDTERAEFYEKKYKEAKATLIDMLKLTQTSAKSIPSVVSNNGPWRYGSIGSNG